MLQPSEEQLREVFAGVSPDGPGCAVGVWRQGELAWGEGFGLANLEHGVPVTIDTVFDIASTSKQFTAFCVLLLAQDGELDLDSPIGTHFPEFRLDPQPTIRQLIHHTGGLRDIYAVASMVGWSWSELMTDDQVVDLLATQTNLDFEPGTSHSYSNSGYVVLSALVRRVSGKSLREFAAERIFVPLGMRSTAYRDDLATIVAGRASGYRRASEGWELAESPSAIVGDGAVNTTIRDFTRWEGEFLTPSLLDETHRAIQLQTARLAGGDADTGYAAGLMVGTHRGIPMMGHAGAWMGYRAEYIRFPDHGLAVAVFANSAGANPSGLARRVADLYLADIVKPEAPVQPDEAPHPAPKSLEPANCAGLFGDGSTFLDVAVAGEGLRISANGEVLEAKPAGGGYEIEAPPLRFTFAPGESPSEPTRLVVSHSGRTVWTLQRTARHRLTEADGKALSGDYRCDEVDAVWTVSTGDGKMVIDRGHRGKVILRPGPPGVFIGDEFTVSSEQGPDGRVRALIAASGRAKGLRFSRPA